MQVIIVYICSVLALAYLVLKFLPIKRKKNDKSCKSDACGCK